MLSKFPGARWLLSDALTAPRAIGPITRKGKKVTSDIDQNTNDLAKRSMTNTTRLIQTGAGILEGNEAAMHPTGIQRLRALSTEAGSRQIHLSNYQGINSFASK
jgi:hypothetical protein